MSIENERSLVLRRVRQSSRAQALHTRMTDSRAHRCAAGGAAARRFAAEKDDSKRVALVPFGRSWLETTRCEVNNITVCCKAQAKALPFVNL